MAWQEIMGASWPPREEGFKEVARILVQGGARPVVG